VTIFVYFVMLYYVRQRAVLLEESDRLLRNILPERIARQLKHSDRTIAESFDAVSVLFADIVGFTPMSARLSAPQLVGLLDEVFTSMDRLVEERGLEKIKTIGDAYMVGAGVPEPRPDHAVVLCDLAIEIRDLTKSRVFDGHQIRFRIGVNSGPLVAGVIGTRKFSYDLWGDVVNTASRMESSGVPGEIQITESTRQLVEHEFVCESRGQIAVKGKGTMETWTLTDRR
jgi:guanylate cyclase